MTDHWSADKRPLASDVPPSLLVMNYVQTFRKLCAENLQIMHFAFDAYYALHFMLIFAVNLLICSLFSCEVLLLRVSCIETVNSKIGRNRNK